MNYILLCRNSDTVDQDEDITKELQDGDLFVKVGDQFIEVPIESLGMDVAAGYKTNGIHFIIKINND